MVFCLLLSCTIFVNAQSVDDKTKDLKKLNKRELEKKNESTATIDNYNREDANYANFISQCLKVVRMEEVQSSENDACKKADNWFCDNTHEISVGRTVPRHKN